jgi:aspartate aminotransferase-like enzyme
VSIYYGLDVSLPMMRAEGREAIFARHAAAGALVRGRAQAMGLELFADPAFASNTVTAIRVPESVDAKALTKALREDEGVVFAGGQEHLDGKIIRIGHLGYFTQADLTACMDALERRLTALGYRASASAAQTGA